MIEQYIPKLSEPARRWARFAALLVMLGGLCWLLYALRAVFTPLLVALAIAYIVNPLVTAMERGGKVSRLAVVTVVFVLLGALLVGGGLYVGSQTVAQVRELGTRLPGYLQQAERWLSRSAGSAHVPTATGPADEAPHATRPAADTQPTAEPPADEWWRLALPLLREQGAAILRSAADHVAGAVSSIVGLLSLLVLLPLYTFFFLWRFNDIVRVIHEHLPAAYRDGVVHVVRTIDAAMADFFRGRLIVCLIVGLVSGVGWSIVGVPYSLPLGILVGVLNLVPFLSLLVLPPALFLRFLSADEVGASWAWPVALTMGVYMFAQALESFVLGPYIQGRSSGLHPITIVVALLIGAELGGLLGMLLAIPLAGTFKTLAAELLLPEIRRLAAKPPPPPQETQP